MNRFIWTYATEFLQENTCTSVCFHILFVSNYRISDTADSNFFMTCRRIQPLTYMQQLLIKKRIKVFFFSQ